MRLYLDPYLGPVLLGEPVAELSFTSDVQVASPAHVQAMFTAIIRQHHALGRPLSAKTLTRIRATLRAALNAAMRRGLIVRFVKAMLRRIDQLTTDITEVTTRISDLCRPWEDKIARLCTIPGFSVTTAKDMIAEIGVDMFVLRTAEG